MSTLTKIDSTAAARRTLGWSILIMFVMGIYAEATRSTLIDWNDPQVTWNNIEQSRIGFSLVTISFIIIIILDTVIAVGIYVLFRAQGFFLVALTAALRITYVAIKGAALTGLVLAGNIYLGEEHTNGAALRAMELLRSHQHGFGIGLIIFGLHLILLSYVARQTQFPKWMCWMLWLAGLGYIVNSVSSLFFDNQTVQMVVIGIFILPMIFSEVVFFLRLWLRGFSHQELRSSGQPLSDAA
jgi:hypothetical protein